MFFSICSKAGYSTQDHRAPIRIIPFREISAVKIPRKLDSNNSAVLVLLNKVQCAADEVAVAVGEVAVVALDEGVEAEAAVLAEGDFAEEEVAEDVGGEEVLLVFPDF